MRVAVIGWEIRSSQSRTALEACFRTSMALLSFARDFCRGPIAENFTSCVDEICVLHAFPEEAKKNIQATAVKVPH